jgi:2,4-dienoyl-CoA reductase-like NADH-dependent reductase (Old Yellow Enzyme family)
MREPGTPIVKHALPAAHWPDAATAARSLLFSSGRIGPRTTTSRSWVPAMVPWRATDDGFVTPDVLSWYGRYADGAPGVLVVEATGIRDVPSGPLLRIGHDRFVPGLRELTNHVRERSGGRTRLFLQILDFLSIRRRPEKEKFFARFLALTPRHRDAVRERFGAAAAADDTNVRTTLAGCDDEVLRTLLTPREFRDYAYGAREEVSDLHLPHVRELPQVLPGLFADAAARARDAGFDGVELHFAHAYTMASFLSRTNVRDDGYGGSLTARQRLPLEVIAAVQQRVGGDFAVGARRGVRARRAALPVDQQGRQVRRCEAAERRRSRVSVHRPLGARVHADGAQRRARAVRPQRRTRCRDPPRGARRRPRHAGGRRRRPLRVHADGSDPAAR